jgi:putative membrane protein
MVRDHKAVNDQALALVKKLHVTPQDNETSKALTKQATANEAELKHLNGAAFDEFVGRDGVCRARPGGRHNPSHH